MADLKTLQDEYAGLVNEARSKFDEIKDDTPEDRAAEIEREFDAMMADADKKKALIERHSKLDAATRSVESMTQQRVARGVDVVAEGRDQSADIDYQSAFHAYLAAGGEMGALDREVRDVLQAGYGNMEKRAQTTTNAAGGYSIPETMLQVVIETMKAWGPMYDGNVVSEIVTTGGNPMPMPTVDDTSVTAGTHTEGATLTDDGGKDITFGTKQLDAFGFETEWLRISKELADDSFIAMESFVGRMLGERLARIANLQLTTGSGSSAPNGIATAVTTGVTAAGTAAVTWDETLDLEHSVDPAYRVGPRVGYMFNDATLLALRKLKDGDGNYLWQAGNVAAGVPNTFNGRPYWINQDMPGLATGLDAILFGDFSAYYVRKVGQPLVAAINDKDFWPGFGMAGYIRFDGELSDTAAVKALTLA